MGDKGGIFKRYLFDKTVCNKNKEKHFYQTIAMQLLSNFETIKQF